MSLDPVTIKNRDMWLNGNYDKKTKESIKNMSQQELNDAFHSHLEFGTGGMRGIMGVGTSRLNKYTIEFATQGLAQYILSQPKPENGFSAIIGYDSRNNSKEFAQYAAKVLAGNGIKVLIFKSVRPTPLISFGCRLKKCTAGIMITASHNPPQYNGYKVYWSDGGQVLPPHDQAIIKEVSKITDPSKVNNANSMSHPLIEIINNEIDNVYYNTIKTLQHYPTENHKLGNTLKIVYTNLHGTGITLMPKALETWGFTNISYVDSQKDPNGDFPTVNSPNPEEKEALTLGLEQMNKENADLLIATDPDADRMGVAVRHNDTIELLTGNQIASLCLYHICKALTTLGHMPKKAAFIKTIATTELFTDIAKSFKTSCFDVLPGFKYIANLMQKWETSNNGYNFIFGGEESYGYLLGTYSHDKDGIISSALIAEVALHAKQEKKSLIDLLYQIFDQYGVFIEKLHSIKFKEGKVGRDQITNGIKKIEQNPPSQINGINVKTFSNFKNSTKTNIKTGEKKTLNFPKSSAFLFYLEDGSKILVRPSGTEPKIKIYCGISQKEFSSVPESLSNCQKKADQLIQSITKDLTN